MTTTHHRIDFGESLRWEPADGVAAFFVWAKKTSDNSPMRWRRVAGYNLLTNMPVAVPESSGSTILPGGSIDMSWSDLLIVFDGFDPGTFPSHRARRGHEGCIHLMCSASRRQRAQTPRPSPRRNGRF